MLQGTITVTTTKPGDTAMHAERLIHYRSWLSCCHGQLWMPSNKYWIIVNSNSTEPVLSVEHIQTKINEGTSKDWNLWKSKVKLLHHGLKVTDLLFEATALLNHISSALAQLLHPPPQVIVTPVHVHSSSSAWCPSPRARPRNGPMYYQCICILHGWFLHNHAYVMCWLCICHLWLEKTYKTVNAGIKTKYRSQFHKARETLANSEFFYLQFHF